MSAQRPIPLHELAFELKLAIGRDVTFNQDFETFIARQPEGVDVRSLKATLDYCRQSTAKLSELYALISTLSEFDDEVRALAKRAAKQSECGPSAAR